MIAKIAVSAATFAIDKPYSYRIPEGMELQPGMRVQVPFGRGNKRTEGIVLSVEAVEDRNLKSIDCCLDKEPVLTQQMLRLAAFMRERYFCTLFDAVRVMLPAGLWFDTKNTITLTEDRSWQNKTMRQKDAPGVLQLLLDLGGQAEVSVLRKAVPDADELDAALQYLQKKKWITAQQDFLARTGDKTEPIATLATAHEEIAEYLSRRVRSPQQRAVLELLCNLGTASVKELCYHTGANSSTVKRLAELGYIKLEHRPVLRCRQITPAEVTGPLELNEEQAAAFAGLAEQMDRPQPGSALLYGVTGSGKTAVYLSLIRRALDRNRSAMLLVPEIALTPQLLSLLAGHFGEQVAVLHSSLPAGERYDQWKRIRSGDAKVIVGTRSAVFAPSPSLGLIILDEEQEHSYKSESDPRYSAKEVALWRGFREQALVLLGSATPSVETMYRAKQGDHTLYRLQNRYNGKALPQVQVVDMCQELREGNDTGFSIDLREAIMQTRDAGKQTIVFLNRRGNSRCLVCVDCRQAPECVRCSAKLTYHSANQRLMCHYCGYSQPVTETCPSCGGHLKRVGIGTQKAQQELNGLFPEMEVLRMDADTVSASNTHEKILEHFVKDNVPVLIGTQMVAKGLNLPDVTLVGVLDADLGLYSGSYRAAETTFNMLTQVVGRAGRGDSKGKAVIQTMVPEHAVLKLAAEQNYDGFYDLEIRLRQVQNCPPFADLTEITFVGQEEGAVLRGAAKFRESLLTCLRLPEYTQEKCTVLGPAPCPVPKINYNFRYRLTLRCGMNKALRGLIAHLLRQFALDGANRGVHAYADVNGYDA